MNEDLTLTTACPAPFEGFDGDPCTTSSGLQTFTGALFLLSLALILALVFLA